MNRIPATLVMFLLTPVLPGLAGAADLPARLVAGADRDLGVPISGVVTRVDVSPGDRVEAGEELLRLEQSGLSAKRQATRARMESEELAWEEARREKERAQTLYDRTELSDHDLQIAINEAAAAKADYREAVAAHEQARLDHDYSRLQAPVAGEVVAVDAYRGMAVSNRDRVRTLVRFRPDEAPLAVVAQLETGEDGDLAVGENVPVVRGDDRAEAVVRELEPVEGGWRVRLVLEGEVPEGWRPGHAVKLEVPE
ncbi:MAG: efflux RND transporter periplasmic adaptor subunit [Thiohalospira sp.]